MIINNNKLVANNSRIISIDNFDSMTTAYVSGMTTKLDYLHIRLIDKFVVTVKSILQKADVVYLGNINNSNDSFRNLVKDAHHGTIQGTGLVFDPYWGWSNPEGTGYVNTNYNPATQGVNYQQNSAYVGVYKFGNNTDNYDNSMVIGQRSNCYMYYYYSVNNNTTSFKGILPFDNGLHSMRRLSSSSSNFLNQNIVNTVQNYESSAVHSSNFFIFRNAESFSLLPYNKGVSFVYIGGGLSDDEHKQLNDAVNDYLIQCLFLKYGHDNWGVKMAKSYFLELHNFDRYEAFEVYEFIKRHQPDYTPERFINCGNVDTTDWVDSNADGLADDWYFYGNLAPSIVTGNGFSGNAQRVECSTGGTQHNLMTYKSLDLGVNKYILSFKYRSNINWSISNGIYATIPMNTGDAKYWSSELTSIDVIETIYFRFFSTTSGTTGSWLEIDEISFKSVNNFDYINFSGNTVANHIMMFKSGGNLIANTWSKSGAALRWNQDGIINISNIMPAYTRRGNLGIVTVTSIDGWNGVTMLRLNQTSGSVNSFYGNFPKFIGNLKTDGNKCDLYISYNRMRVDVRNQPLSILSLMIYIFQVTPGYSKLNINQLIGGTYSIVYAMGDLYNPNSKVSGDLSQLTNEITQNIYIRYDKSIYGNLKNIIVPSTMVEIYCDNTSISGGLSMWNKNIGIYAVNMNFFSTKEVDSQLKLINDYFVLNTPIRNLTINLGGSTMGIPTGGANNTDLLGIIAKHNAAGFTATITVRTV